MSSEVHSKTRVSELQLAIEPASAAPAAKRSLGIGRWWKRALLAVGSLAVVAAASALVILNTSPTDSAKVLTHTISRGELLVTVTEEGSLESAVNKEIKCKVKGGSTILWIIEDGTEVKPGDELVRLDASTIEDNISQQRITYETALASKIQAESDLAVAEINVDEYLEGTFRKEMQTAESNVAIAEENLRVAENILSHAQKMFQKGYVSELELDGNEYSLQYAQLQLALMKTEVDVLERFTKPKMLQELRSALKTAKAKLASEETALKLEEERLRRLEEQRDGCVIHAETNGMVIYPETEEWRNEPAIEEGSTVREQQTLLQIPDLSNMQVKVGIHESKVRQLKPGMPARIEIQDGEHVGEIISVAKQASPTGWWDSNIRKFDAIVKLHGQPDVRPGMSAEVEITVARHKNVLTIPVAAVVEYKQEFHCWVKTDKGMEKRPLKLGASNDQFIVVEEGLSEGDRVVLNPRDFVEEAQVEALKPLDETQPAESDEPNAEHEKPVDAADSQASVPEANGVR